MVKPPRARKPVTWPSAQTERQSGVKINNSCVARQQHLGNRRCRAKIPVNLEDRSFSRRMGVKEIQVRAVLHQHGERIPGRVSISQARPEVDRPRATPTCIRAAVSQPPFERNTRCLRKIRRCRGRDLLPGYKP
jgi:hypothetical protein